MDNKLTQEDLKLVNEMLFDEAADCNCLRSAAISLLDRWEAHEDMYLLPRSDEGQPPVPLVTGHCTGCGGVRFYLASRLKRIGWLKDWQEQSQDEGVE